MSNNKSRNHWRTAAFVFLISWNVLLGILLTYFFLSFSKFEDPEKEKLNNLQESITELARDLESVEFKFGDFAQKIDRHTEEVNQSLRTMSVPNSEVAKVTDLQREWHAYKTKMNEERREMSNIIAVFNDIDDQLPETAVFALEWQRNLALIKADVAGLEKFSAQVEKELAERLSDWSNIINFLVIFGGLYFSLNFAVAVYLFNTLRDIQNSIAGDD